MKKDIVTFNVWSNGAFRPFNSNGSPKRSAWSLAPITPLKRWPAVRNIASRPRRDYRRAPSMRLIALPFPAAASIAPDLHVLIGSVPWRRRSLNRLIQNIAAQTLLPAEVHLVLDGDGEPNAVLNTYPLTARGVKVSVREQHPARGAGSRWDVADELLDTDVICNLDDDVGLCSNHFISCHYATIQTVDAVCVGGYTPEGRFIMCDKAGIDYDGPINCLQAGAVSFRVKCLRGLRAMPMAGEMLGLLGDDEGLIAAHLWMKGVMVKRVNTPVAFDPSGSDPRSQFLNGAGRIVRFRNRLRAVTGWPWGNV